MSERVSDKAIVVGVDGSGASRAALRWALEQARALGTRLVAVHAWEPAAAGFAPYAPVAARPTAAKQRARAAELLATAVHEAFGPCVDPAVHALLVEGPPVRVLLQQARGALLLALGRGSHPQLPGVGAVGRECLRHATVPVVTVPAPERPEGSLGAVRESAGVRSGAA